MISATTVSCAACTGVRATPRYRRETFYPYHNDPDPDRLASAFAPDRIAMAAGIDEHRIPYSGDLSHQQSRAFVDLLDIDLKPFEPAAVRDRPEGSLLGFVDHAVPGSNSRVPEGTPVDIVIDHHPNEGIEVRFIGHRGRVGATATILTEHVRESGVYPETRSRPEPRERRVLPRG